MTDQLDIEVRLQQLDPPRLAAFCAALTERLFPNFALFSRLVEFGDAAQLRQILNGVWDHLGNTGAKMNFEVQLDKVEANLPDLDDFDMYGASPALDAVLALFSTVTCVLEGDAEEAIAVANLSRECVANFIEVTEGNDQMSDEELVRFINTHEMMQQEEAFQDDVLALLEAGAKLNASRLKELRTLGQNEGFSNIGISDDD
ncbi:MAG: YjaG family protein [Oceanospirillaceae bacterium]|nr:YjaG family protein [Oceanospirillaceae bacterium]